MGYGKEEKQFGYSLPVIQLIKVIVYVDFLNNRFFVF